MPPDDIPSVRQLRIFVAVAAAQSVSGAAKGVNLSQPGVTQSLHALERRLGVELFERRGSGCYLTQSGAILLPRIERFFDQFRLALGDAGVSAPEVGVNRITGPHIRSLIAVCENSSLAAAARALKIAQPSLHRAAKGLEGELRRRLFQRTSQGMTTNTLGTQIARRFQIALREITYGIEEVQAARGHIISRIIIGNIPHSGGQVLSSAINEFFVAYPAARVQVVDGHYEALLNDLRAAKLDFLFGVLRRPAWADDVQEEALFRNPYVVVARTGHPLSRSRAPGLRELCRYEWIMPGPMTPRQQAFLRLFTAAPVQPKISVETTSLQIHRDLVATTDRLTLMSSLEARLNDPDRLTVLPFRSSGLRRMDGLATRIDWQPTDIHRHFLKVLRRHARRLTAASPCRRAV
jgi:LysR family transcriptional regulator, regulator for genes of the gallate degradation pathway